MNALTRQSQGSHAVRCIAMSSPSGPSRSPFSSSSVLPQITVQSITVTLQNYLHDYAKKIRLMQLRPLFLISPNHPHRSVHQQKTKQPCSPNGHLSGGEQGCFVFCVDLRGIEPLSIGCKPIALPLSYRPERGNNIYVLRIYC